MSPSRREAPVSRPAENWARMEAIRKPSARLPDSFPTGPGCSRANTRQGRTPRGGEHVPSPCSMTGNDRQKITGPPVGSTSAGCPGRSPLRGSPPTVTGDAAVVGGPSPRADPAFAVPIHPPPHTPQPTPWRGSGLHVRSPGQGLAIPPPRSLAAGGGATGARCFRKRENQSCRGQRRLGIPIHRR